MISLVTLDAAICGLICLRVIFYRRRGATHRPLASAIAYLVVIASGSVTLRALLGNSPAASLPDTALHLVLCLAVFATGGNVSAIFATPDADNRIYKLIRGIRHA